MGGECYALSADLVRYVATSTAILPHVRGKEDKKVAQWMNLHPNRTSINWVSEHCWVYDHPKAGTAYSHGFLFPDYVEKIKTEARRGLSDQEIARRGGEHRAKSYSSVSKWRQAYIPPRDDLTMEEEVEALIEGGGRWSGTWVRGEEGNDTWVPWEEIVFEANDERLRPVGPLGQGALAADVGLEPSSGLPVYGAAHPGVENSAPQSQKLRDREEQPSDISAEVLVQRDPGWLDQGPEDDSGFLPNLQGFPNIAQLHRQHEQLRSSHGLRAPPPRLIPHPTNKDSGDEAAALRARRYLGRPHGGTVVVHFLKKSEWFLETAVAFLGRQKTWVDGAGGVGSEWRMFGSPLLRHDNYVSEGRSQPRPEPNVAPDVRIPDASSSGTSQTASRASKTSTSGTRSSSSVETSSSPNRAEESSTVPPPKTTTASGTNHRTGHHV